MRSSSCSGLSTSFVNPFGTCLSYTVNKHKSMIVNTLFVRNHFFNNNKHNNKEIPFLKKVVQDVLAKQERCQGFTPLTKPLKWVKGRKHQHLELSCANCSSRESYNQQKMKLFTDYCCYYI